MDNSKKLSLFRTGMPTSTGFADISAKQYMEMKKIEFTWIEKGCTGNDNIARCLPGIFCIYCVPVCWGLGCKFNCGSAFGPA